MKCDYEDVTLEANDDPKRFIEAELIACSDIIHLGLNSQKLEHDISVLIKKIEVDARLARQSAASAKAAARDREEHLRQATSSVKSAAQGKEEYPRQRKVWDIRLVKG